MKLFFYEEVKGESLVMLIDGQKVTFQSHVVSRKVVSGGLASEIASYYVTQQRIKQIGHSKEIKIRIYYTDGYMEKKLSAKNIERFRSFYTEHVRLNEMNGYEQPD